ncbi:hypothetical protein HDV00_001717 [Rhizophlyctis rosea]|nr:hypothetical protein HDV00_001717 [Rhizophlyctis rosea]
MAVNSKPVKKAILLVGRSGAGKSTFACHLLSNKTAATVSSGPDSIQTDIEKHWCDALNCWIVDTPGLFDTNGVSNEDLQINILRAIKDSGLEICLVIYLIDDRFRRTLANTVFLDAIRSIHPAMPDRIVLLSILQPAAVCSANYGNSAIHFDFPYTFPLSRIEELMKDPINPIWVNDKCRRCGLKEDRRLASTQCLAHVPGWKQHNLLPVQETTYSVGAHRGHLRHPGHFRGFWWGFTWSCCGRGDNSPCEWSECKCRER